MPIISFYNSTARFVSELNMISDEKMKQIYEEIEKSNKVIII